MTSRWLACFGSTGISTHRHWDLAKVTIQTLMTCLVVNCKRMARLLKANWGLPQEALCPG